MTRYRSFGDFWPHYLREHSRAATRRLHYTGTGLVLAFAAAAAASGDWRLVAAVPLAGYGFAWFSHVAVERNRPATFTHPLWSLVADFRMAWLWATGRLGSELVKAGVEPEPRKGEGDAR
ncbi:MAG TPA: DUF962 domain-containing protein [Allosphingosinicella sp.]|jgi:hypothetical protein